MLENLTQQQQNQLAPTSQQPQTVTPSVTPGGPPPVPQAQPQAQAAPETDGGGGGSDQHQAEAEEGRDTTS